MTKLVWNAAGARLFEAGVDRAVLYVHTLPYGVAWNGIKSVNQKPSGSTTALYNDGVPFHNLQGGTEFSGSIEAFTYPDEFETCDGTRYLDQGISLGEQLRDEFDLSYRTKIGNDQVGLEFAYKIHLIYNATATPATRKFSSTSSNVDPSLFNWDFATVPVSHPGFRPTSHVTIDSRRLTSVQLRFLEELLYGNDAQSPRIPQLSELLELLTSWSALPASSLALS